MYQLFSVCIAVKNMRKGEFITYLPLQYGDWGCLRILCWVKDLGIRENKSIYSEEFYK
jgi:hypothetical protein